MKTATIVLLLALALNGCASMQAVGNKAPTDQETVRDLEMEGQRDPSALGM